MGGIISGSAFGIKTPEAAKANLTTPYTANQATEQYNAVNNQLAQQGQYLQQLQAQHALQNQTDVFGQQQQLANQLQQRAMGAGPNPALEQLRQQTAANTANQAALMASQRGAGANTGLLARQAAMQGAANQQASVGQAATMQANQQIAAQQQLAQQQQAMQSAAGQQAGQLQNQYQATGAQQLQAQANINQAIANQNNAQIANTQQANAATQALYGTQMGIVGGLIGGASSALTMSPTGAGAAGGGGGGVSKMAMPFSDGGKVPGKAEVPGDSRVNDTVPTMLSPGEIVIPRSIVDHPDAAKLAAEFVKHELGKHATVKAAMAQGGMQGDPKSLQELHQGYDEANDTRDVYQKVGDAISPALAAMPGVNAFSMFKGAVGAMPGPSDDSAAPSPEQAPTNMPIQAVQQPTQNVIPPVNPLGPIQEGMQQYQSGLQKEAAAQGAMGKEQAAAQQQYQQQQQQMLKDFNAKQQELQSQSQAIVDYQRQNPIDAQRYMKNLSTVGKASTAIGLILGGLSSGMTGKGNPALDTLHKLIDNDIESQRMDMNKQNNLLSQLHNQMGNLRDATVMAKSIQADALAAKMNEIAGQSADPLAKARAEQAAAELKMKYAPQIAQIALRQAVFQGMRNGQVAPEQAARFLVPEGQQKEAMQEISGHNKAQATINNVAKAMRDVGDLTSIKSTLASPLQSLSKINAANTAIDSTTRELFGGTMSEPELEAMQKGFHVSRFDTEKTIQDKIERYAKTMEVHAQTPTLKSAGIELPKFTTPPATKKFESGK